MDRSLFALCRPHGLSRVLACIWAVALGACDEPADESNTGSAEMGTGSTGQGTGTAEQTSGENGGGTLGDSGTTGTMGDAWQLTARGLPAALFSISEDRNGGLWAAGADLGAGAKASVFVYRGLEQGWQVVDHQVEGSLWWLTPMPGGRELLAVGDAGTMARIDAELGVVTATTPVPTEMRLYGAFVAADGETWVCGGDVANRSGLLWTDRGGSWAIPEGLDPTWLEDFTPFKIWRQAGQAWVVGLGGRALHHDGTQWQQLEVPGGARLITVHGNGGRLLAVGGNGRAAIMEWHPSGFVDVSPSELAPALNGVFVKSDGGAVAVGGEGSVWTNAGPQLGWLRVEELPGPIIEGFHAVHVDRQGSVHAVGGMLLSEPATDGLVLSKAQPSP